jgi:hypothetical protein
MSINSFRVTKFEDFEILDGGGSTLGHVRVKPSTIQWRPKNAKRWYGVSLPKFAEFAIDQGRKQKK